MVRHQFFGLVFSCALGLACSSSTNPAITATGSGVTGPASGSSISGSSGTAERSSSETTGTGTTGGTGSGGSPSTGGNGITGLGQPCDPGTQPDSCASDGLACDATSSTCELPGELVGCLESVGCSDPKLACTAGFQNNGQDLSLCVYPCTDTSDCPDPLTNCQAEAGNQICFYNLCAQDGTGFFDSCPSAATADGMCLPYDVPGGVTGICLATGPLDDGATCTGFRATDGGVGGLCAQGSNCAAYGVNGQATVSVCQQICDSSAQPTGPTCGAADMCAGYTGTDYGNCLEICGADTTVVCPDGTSCQNLSFADGLFTLCVPTG